MTTTETGHEHDFALETPGVFSSAGPCECGLTREQALAGDRGRVAYEAHCAVTAERAGVTSQARTYAELPHEIRARYDAGAQAVAAPLERERNILRGQLECAELTITDYRNALTAQRAEFDRLSALLSEARITAPMLAAAFRRLRVVTVAPDGMPLEHGPLAASIIEDLHGAPVGAKAAIEEAARHLDYPDLAATITAAFPPAVQGREIPLAAIFDGTHPRFLEADKLRAMYAGHPAVRSVIDAAVGIEGRKAVAS
jgi:hypothetical protein